MFDAIIVVPSGVYNHCFRHNQLCRAAMVFASRFLANYLPFLLSHGTAAFARGNVIVFVGHRNLSIAPEPAGSCLPQVEGKMIRASVWSARSLLPLSRITGCATARKLTHSVRPREILGPMRESFGEFSAAFHSLAESPRTFIVRSEARH